MTLFPQNPGYIPLGQFDCLDTDAGSLRGGEVMEFTRVARGNTSTERGAADVLDGYDYSGNVAGGNRIAAQIATGTQGAPVFLADEGTSPGYFTMFGAVVGSTVGLLTTGGAVLGPHTTAGSGKVTLWDKPGLYVVTLDAVSADFESAAPSAGVAPGAAIGYDNLGKLAHTDCSAVVASTGVAYFLEAESGRSTASLVNTPPRLVGASEVFDRIKVWFHAGLDSASTV